DGWGRIRGLHHAPPVRGVAREHPEPGHRDGDARQRERTGRVTPAPRGRDTCAERSDATDAFDRYSSFAKQTLVAVTCVGCATLANGSADADGTELQGFIEQYRSSSDAGEALRLEKVISGLSSQGSAANQQADEV